MGIAGHNYSWDSRHTIYDNPIDSTALIIKYGVPGIELDKWIKQHLRIKKFFGTSENALKTQIWIAISTYVLVAIMKKRLKIDLPLYNILQIISISLFEKKPIYQVLAQGDYKNKMNSAHIQLKLFES